MTAGRFLYVIVIGLASTAYAAPPQGKCAALAKHTPAFYYCDLIDKVQNGPDKPGAAADLAKFFTDTQKLPAAYSFSMLDAIFQRAQDTRVDKQTGAPVSANGSTNLVSLPGATDLLSVAVASGALTETVSGATTTFAANIGQTISTLQRSSFDYSLKGLPVLQNIDVTLSLGTNPGSSQSIPVSSSSSGTSTTAGSATLAATHTTITGATVRYQFFNKFDPQSAQFKNAFQQYQSLNSVELQKSKNSVAAASQKLVSDFQSEAADTATLDLERNKFLSAKDTSQLIELFNTYFLQVRQKVSSNPSFSSDLAGFVSAMNADLSLYRTIVGSAKGVPALTMEYTYTDIPNQPPTHNARVIAAVQNSAGLMLTGNAAATFYGSLPSGTQTSSFRDFQAAAQGDIPIASQAMGNAIDLSFAGYGQYQQAASILTVTASDLPAGFPANAPAFVAGTKGWLGVGQLKLTIRGPSGVQIVPLSWKWSNRTDLFNQSNSGFQFGLSYDVSSLGQLFGGH